MEFCTHRYGPRTTEVRDGLLRHRTCGKPIQCEFGLENPHPATHWHQDYDVVCDEHESQIPEIERKSAESFFSKREKIIKDMPL